MLHRRVVSAYVLALVVLAYAPAPAQSTGLANLPSGVSIHQLDNGLRVLLIEHPGLPMTGSNVVIGVGSAYETFATSGMSHMLEHLLFNGTKSRTQEELYADVDKLGAYNNANTGTYFTNFMMVAANDKIVDAMKIQADMLFASILPVDKFDKEKGIVLEEIAKSLADPKEQIERGCLDFLYPGHALSLPVLGTYATIEAMSRDDVYAFYKNHYVPNNMLMSVVGNFESTSMLNTIKDIFGKAAPANVRSPRHEGWHVGYDAGESVASTGEPRVAHRFHAGQSTVIHVFFELEKSMPPAFFDLLDRALDDHLPQLEAALEKRHAERVHAVAFAARPAPVRTYLEFSLTLKGGGPVADIAREFGDMVAAREFSLAEDVVTAMATRTRTEFLKNIEKPHMFGIYNAYQLATEGIESVLASYDTGIFRKNAVAVETLNLIRLPRHILIHHPMPAADDAGPDTSRQTKMFDDDSGLRLIATQNAKSDLLAIHYLVTHKAYFESEHGKDAARILHDCLSQRLESEENQALSQRFGLTYTLNDNPFIPMDNIYLHPDFAYLRIEGLADDPGAAIGFVNDQLAGFTPTKDEYQAAVDTFKRLDHPMGRHMGGGDFDRAYKDLIYEPAPFAEPEDQVTFEGLLAFAEVFFHPANMIVAVTSPSSPERVWELFLPWAQASPPMDMSLPDAYQRTLRVRTEETRIEREIGGDQSFLFFGFTKAIDSRDRAALEALGLILSDRIVFDVREKQGMAYRMSAGIDFYGDRALFFVKVPTRKTNVDALAPQLPTFFDPKYVADMSQDELEKAVNQYLGRMKFRRLSSINQAYYRCTDVYFHNDPDHAEKSLDALKDVTLEQVVAVAEKYLSADNPVTVIMR